VLTVDTTAPWCARRDSHPELRTGRPPRYSYATHAKLAPAGSGCRQASVKSDGAEAGPGFGSTTGASHGKWPPRRDSHPHHRLERPASSHLRRRGGKNETRGRNLRLTPIPGAPHVLNGAALTRPRVCSERRPLHGHPPSSPLAGLGAGASFALRAPSQKKNTHRRPSHADYVGTVWAPAGFDADVG
jgi:hypothetical protein